MSKKPHKLLRQCNPNQLGLSLNLRASKKNLNRDFSRGWAILANLLEELVNKVQERMSAPGQGLIDFGVDTLNTALSTIMRGLEIPKIPKATKYEDGVAQATRTNFFRCDAYRAFARCWYASR